MAECKVTKVTKVVLYLNEEEASFIKHLCQNSLAALAETIIKGGEYREEPAKTKEIRENIFNALQQKNI